MKLLSFVIVPLMVILGNVDGISLQTKTEGKLSLPTDEKSLMLLLLQDNPGNVFLSLLNLKRKPHFTKKTVLKVIGLIDKLIAKAHKKRAKAIKIQQAAFKRLQNAQKKLLKKQERKAKLQMEIKSARFRKKNYKLKEVKLKAELSHLQAIKRKLLHVLRRSRKRKSFLSENSNIISSNTSSSIVLTERGESNEATSVLGLFSMVSPHKVQSMMNEVDAWIVECLGDKKQLDVSSKLMMETLRKSELEFTFVKKEEEKAENEKDTAQKKYDAIIQDAVIRKDKEVRLLQQIQLMFAGMIPDNKEILI